MVVMKGVYAPRHWPILDSDGMITVSKTIAVYLVSYLPIPSNETKSSLLLKYMGLGAGGGALEMCCVILVLVFLIF